MVLDRRGFIKFVAGASAGIMATPLPWKLLDDVSIWSQNWSWIPRNQPGESTYAHAVSKMCPSGAPMRVRLVDGRPVRVLPVADHPLGGGLSSLAVSEIQMLYSPARVKRPLRRAPDGAFLEMNWDDAVKLLKDKVSAAKSDIAFLSGDENGSINEVLSAFARAVGSDEVCLMPSDGQCAAKAAELMGINAQIGYDLENSDHVLAIGANLLESWGTVVRNRRIFKDRRPHPFATGDGSGDAPSATFAYAGPVQHNTAAVAKPWLPIYPGTEGVFALTLANMLIARGRQINSPDFAAFKTLAARYTPEKTAEITGADPARLEEHIVALLAANAPLVIVGSEFNQGSGAAPIMAGIAVNALLGNINKPGGLRLLPPAKTVMAGASSRTELYRKDLASWLSGAKKNAVLVMYEANPAYALPGTDAVKAALSSIPFKVSFSTFMDESAALCDLVLPIGMGLERVDDLDTPYGSDRTVYCVTTPVCAPGENVRGAGNTLLYIARQMGMDLGFELYQDLLKAKARLYGKGEFEALAAGRAAVLDATVEPSFKLRPEILGKALADALRPKDKLLLAPYAKLNLGTAKTGIPPYNTKTLRAGELDGAAMSVLMNRETAKARGLTDGDPVVLASDKGKIRARLRVFEGVMHESIAVCLGFGHTALDEFSQKKGANVMELMTAAPESATGLSVWAQTGVTVAKA